MLIAKSDILEWIDNGHNQIIAYVVLKDHYTICIKGKILKEATFSLLFVHCIF